MQFQQSHISSIVAGIGVFFATLGVYWVVEFARGIDGSGSNLWACVFVAVLCSILFYFDQRRIQDKTTQSS